MARLPQPGGDAGEWGQILNDFLGVAHNSDGTLKLTPSSTVADDSITEPKLSVANSPATGQALTWNGSALVWANPTAGASALGGVLSGTTANAQYVAGSVNNVALAAGAVTTAGLADAAVTNAKITDATITEAKLAPAVVTKLNAGSTVADGTLTPAKLNSDTPATGEILSYNGIGFEWITAPAAGGSGETNTASNVGTSGVGIYAQKTGVNLEFKKLAPASATVAITDNVSQNTVDIDVNQASLDLANIGGSLAQARVTGLSAALDAKLDDSQLGQANGVASLDGSGKVPASQLPSSGSSNTDLSTTADATTVTVASSTGADTILASATTTVAGVLTAADKTKLDTTPTDIQASLDAKLDDSQLGQPSGVASLDSSGKVPASQLPSATGTDLSTSTTASTVTVVSSSGANTVLAAATTTDAGVMTAADKTKLDTAPSDIQAALDAKLDDSQLNQPNGVAGLDGSGKIDTGTLKDYAVRGEANTFTATNELSVDDANALRVHNSGDTVTALRVDTVDNSIAFDKASGISELGLVNLASLYFNAIWNSTTSTTQYAADGAAYELYSDGTDLNVTAAPSGTAGSDAPTVTRIRLDGSGKTKFTPSDATDALVVATSGDTSILRVDTANQKVVTPTLDSSIVVMHQNGGEFHNVYWNSGLGSNSYLADGPAYILQQTGGNFVLKAATSGTADTAASFSSVVYYTPEGYFRQYPTGTDTDAFGVYDTTIGGTPYLRANTSDKVVHIGQNWDSGTAIPLVLAFQVSTTDPSSPYDGSLYYNGTTGKVRVREAGTWKDAIGVSATGGRREDGHAETLSSGTYAIDLANGNAQHIVLTANTTFTITGQGPDVSSFDLYLEQGGTGGYTVSWPASVKWPGATPPTITSATSSVDHFRLQSTDAGVSWYAETIGQNYG